MTARVRAPELVGAGGWIGTGGRSLSLADFRGRILILDVLRGPAGQGLTLPGPVYSKICRP
jgi:hypothetical protein